MAIILGAGSCVLASCSGPTAPLQLPHDADRGVRGCRLRGEWTGVWGGVGIVTVVIGSRGCIDTHAFFCFLETLGGARTRARVWKIRALRTCLFWCWPGRSWARAETWLAHQTKILHVDRRD